MGVTLTTPRPSHGALNWDAIIEADLAALATAINYGANVSDCNNAIQSGYYYASGASNTPGASGQGFIVFVINRGDGAAIFQQAYNIITGQLWIRRYQSSAWTAWTAVVNDTGWVTSTAGFSAATGWTLGALKYRNLNGVVSIGATMTRTGATITANAAGIITATPILNLPAAVVPGQANGVITSAGPASTVTASGYVIASSSVISLTNAAPSQSIASGAVVDLLGTYLL